MAPEATKTVISDATCTRCGCMCDDIELTVADNRILEAKQACRLGQAWFLDRHESPGAVCTIAGRPASLEEGIDQAAQILVQARYPLLYGLSHTTCEAQGKAVAIADWIGGTIDTTTSGSHGPALTAFQSLGQVTATLGEIRHRADLVIYWGVDPAETHPRHFSRYTLMPEGLFVPRGRPDRTCVVVDGRRTASAQEADIFLQVRPGKDFEALWILRALVQGLSVEADQVQSETGVPLTAWLDLAERMKRARYGAMFFGEGLITTGGGHLNAEALLALVRELNDFTRFVCRPMASIGNAVGADNVLSWRTGYPFAVNLSRGYPRFSPGEYTANELLARREADAAMLISVDAATLGPAAQEHLAKIPVIALGSQKWSFPWPAAVSFATALYGISVAGTVYRMDEVPLPLRPAVPSSRPSDYQVLCRLEDRVRQLLVPTTVL